jgi:hypothetical protein
MRTAPLTEASQLEPYSSELGISQPSPRERTSPSKNRTELEKELNMWLKIKDITNQSYSNTTTYEQNYIQKHIDDLQSKLKLMKENVTEGKVKSLLVSSLLILLASTTPPVKTAISKALHTSEGQKIVTSVNREWNKIPQAQKTVEKAKELWKSAISHRHLDLQDPNQPLPDEKDMSAWDLVKKYSDESNTISNSLTPFVNYYFSPVDSH